MSTTLKRSGILSLFIVGAFLLSASFTGVARAQSVTESSGCTPSNCGEGAACYEVTNSAGGKAKSCLTPTQVQSLRSSDSPGSGSDTTAGSGNCGATSGALVNPLKVCSLTDLLDLILVAVIRIGTIVLILMLVWVGFLFVTARGSEEKLRDARRAFFWTIIGGLILLGARGLSAVIQSTANTLGP